MIRVILGRVVLGRVVLGRVVLSHVVLSIALFSLLLSCTAAVRFSGDSNANQQHTKKKTSDTPHPDKSAAKDEGKTTRRTSDQVETGKSSATINDQVEGEIDRARMNRVVANFLGSPYARGGTSRAGIDCSGLMYVVYRDYDGTRLPLSTDALYRLDDRVDFDDLTYGDLIFFRLSGRQVSHVGMYLENFRFVHASESRGVVVDDLTDEYYATSYAGARRIK